MSHLLDEQRLSLSALAARESVNVSTVWRWCLRGCRGAKLESFAIGGRRYTSGEAFSRFIEQINSVAASPSIPKRTARQRSAAIRQSEQELRDAGI